MNNYMSYGLIVKLSTAVYILLVASASILGYYISTEIIILILGIALISSIVLGVWLDNCDYNISYAVILFVLTCLLFIAGQYYIKKSYTTITTVEEYRVQSVTEYISGVSYNLSLVNTETNKTNYMTNIGYSVIHPCLSSKCTVTIEIKQVTSSIPSIKPYNDLTILYVDVL